MEEMMEMFKQPAACGIIFVVFALIMVGMIIWAVKTIKAGQVTIDTGEVIASVIAAVIGAAIIGFTPIIPHSYVWLVLIVAIACAVWDLIFWNKYGGKTEFFSLAVLMICASIAIAVPLYWLGFGFLIPAVIITGLSALVISYMIYGIRKQPALYQYIAIGIAVLLIIGSIAGGLGYQGFKNLLAMLDQQVADGQQSDPELEPVATREPTEEYQQPVAEEEEIPDVLKMYDPERFMNYALQFDDDPSNDFNFGPNVWDPNHTEAKYYDELWRKAMLQCPGICAGCLAWFDCRLGTRKLMGDFYEACKENWATAINVAKDAFILDPELQRSKCELLFTMLDEHATCVIRAGEKGITDQMYIDPYTDNGIPDVIVMETEQTLSHFLVYRVEIKGNIFEVIFRLECGFQPTNCAKEMDIKPVPQPQKKVNPQPTASGNNPPPVTPPPKEKEPQKDKKQDIWQPDKGFPSNGGDEGPDTNNGKGAQESKYEETHTDTQDFNKPEDVKKEQQERKEVDQKQKTGDDPNKPTVTEKDTKKVEQPSERKEIKNDTKNEGGDNKGAWDPSNVP